jgi:hypothetical protein
MNSVISKCGNICSSCPWGVWVRRDQTQEEWELYSEDAKKFTGFYPTKNPCHGCQTPTEKLAKDVGVHKFLRGCSARACAFYNEIQNCAYCSRYPCDKIHSLNAGNRRIEAEQRIGESIPDDKYMSFIRIYEGQKTLDEIREGLRSNQIQVSKIVKPKIPKIVAFPEVQNDKMKYASLHATLTEIFSSELGLSDTDTVAVEDMLEKRRAVLLRLLWISAVYGNIDGEALVVDSITINTYKKGTSGFPTTESSWKRWLEILSGIGIRSELKLAPVERSELISPIGWLRDRIAGTDTPGYHIQISFDKSLGGYPSLQLLQTFAKDLDKQFGKNGYRKFKKVDMRF